MKSIKNPKKSSLDSTFKFEGPTPIKGKTITSHSTMAGYAASDERMPSPRGKGIVKKNRHGGYHA